MKSFTFYSFLALALLLAAPLGAQLPDEPECGNPLLSFEDVNLNYRWLHGSDVAAGTDGRYLSVDDGTAVLADSDGAILSETVFDESIRTRRSAVSADEQGYLIFWTEQSHEPRSNLHFARIGLDGSFRFRGSLPVGEGRRAVDLDAAYSGSHHLLVWSGTDGMVHGQLVNLDGTAGARFEIGAARPCSHLSVAAGESGFALAIGARRTCEGPGRHVSESELRLYFLNGSGSPRSTVVLERENKGGSVTKAGEDWIAVWGSPLGLKARRFDAQGQPKGLPELVVAEETVMQPEVAAAGDDIFVLWTSDIVPDNACGIDWDVAVSRLDSKFRETERHIIGDVYESHCPPFGSPFQPSGDLACDEETCLVVHEDFAAAAGPIEIVPLVHSPFAGDFRFVSLESVGTGRYLATYLNEQSLHVVTVKQDGTLEGDVEVAEIEQLRGATSVTTTADKRFMLITAQDGDLVYGWIIDTRTLEIVRERLVVPRGIVAGGSTSFLIAWKDYESGEDVLQLAIFGLDGEVRLATEVMRGTQISMAPAWLQDRYVVLGMSYDAASIVEVGPEGGPVRSYPVSGYRGKEISAWGTAEGQLLVATRGGDVLLIHRNGSYGRESLPKEPLGGNGGGAFSWDGRLWMSLGWGHSTFAEVDGQEVLRLRGRFLEARDGQIITYTTEAGSRELDLRLHRYGGTDSGTSAVSFSRDRFNLVERGTNPPLTLLRSGSAEGYAEVRVEVVGGDSAPLPFSIPDPIVRFAAGEIQKDLWVIIPNDALYQDVEAVLRIEPVTRGVEVECSGATIVRVRDDDAPRLLPDALVLEEGDGRRTEMIRLALDGGFLRPTLIDLHIGGETAHVLEMATPGEDFESFYASVRVEPGQQFIDVPLTILGDHRPEVDETIALLYWYGSEVSGTRETVFITLVDDDMPYRRRAVGRH